MTHADYSGNEVFKTACDIAGIKPSKRQASKFQKGLGKAYEKVTQAQVIIRNKEFQNRRAV